MSFDPRIIPADDAPLDDDGSLLLPADLGELANQLRDDANYLTTLYPAKAFTPVKLPVTSPARFYRNVLLVAASLLLFAGGMWGWLIHSEGRQSAPKIATSPVVQPLDSSALVSRSEIEQDSAFSVSFEQPHFEGLLLYEYSGPELEGVYDLLDESPQQEISF